MPIAELPWLAKSRLHIAKRVEPLTEPFQNVSEEVLQKLDKAESTIGGLRQVLAEVMKVAREAAHDTLRKSVANVFEDEEEEGQEEEGQEEDSDGEGGSGYSWRSPAVLECSRRAIVLQERIKQNSLIARGTMEDLEPFNEGYTSTPDLEADSDENDFSFEPDADETAVAANYEKTSARRKRAEQDSGKISLYQTHLTYPRKAAAHPRKEAEDSINKEGDSSNKSNSMLGHLLDHHSHLNWVT